MENPNIVDTHKCGDCKKEFESFEDFLIHKLLFEKYKLKIEPSKQIPGLRIPIFFKSPEEDGADHQPALNRTVVQTVCTLVNITNEEDLNMSLLNKPSLCDKEINTTVPSKMEQTNKEFVRESETNLSEKIVTESSMTPEVDVESDDNVSICSQTESLRIDESVYVKDNTASPHPQDPELKQNSELHCKYCDRYYKNKVVLRIHKETVHSSDRPFVCKTCRQAFKTKGSLVRHVRTHTGEKPFCCKECGRAFRDSGSLCRHAKRVHLPLLSQMPTKGVKIFVTKLISEAENKTHLGSSASS